MPACTGGNVYLDFSIAVEKHKVQEDAAHCALELTAACLRKRVSYSSQGVPANCLLALTIIELYARRSLVLSGCLVVTSAMKVLKHITHSSIDVICLRGTFGVDGAIGLAVVPPASQDAAR